MRLGGLALYLARQGDTRVTGITLSEEQLDVAGVPTSGLSTHAEFRLQDYRAVRDRFNRIVSVGMFEHVGVGYYDASSAGRAELLAEDGVMLLHSIGRMDGRGAANPWIDKYIFPAGYTPASQRCFPP
jgi:cyclopropane-fatty-acyl-phospholipid synthase